MTRPPVPVQFYLLNGFRYTGQFFVRGRTQDAQLGIFRGELVDVRFGAGWDGEADITMYEEALATHAVRDSIWRDVYARNAMTHRGEAWWGAENGRFTLDVDDETCHVEVAVNSKSVREIRPEDIREGNAATPFVVVEPACVHAIELFQRTREEGYDAERVSVLFSEALSDGRT